MKPILKYRGGKSKEIPEILRHIPKNYNRYIEPFFGGGALYFYLENKNSIINDINTRLINFYRDVANNYEDMRVQLDKLHKIYERNQRQYEELKAINPDVRVENLNENLFYEMRDLFNNNTTNKYLDSVIYFFINKTAYSGMIRYNKKGEFNVPFGRYKNMNTRLLTNNHHKLLRTAKIYNTSYQDIFNMAEENDFMFLDPPYDCQFTDYGNGNEFTEEDHRELSEAFRNLRCKALMVVSKTPLMEELYADFIVNDATYDKVYGVNIRNRFDRNAEHLIIRNYDINIEEQISFDNEVAVTKV
ncbi:Dam family site-specific DNA-(adenine-N6)-methyltransferase [Clostridium perfringens]|uniref:DNA adenine methylase n=1 Tax=Clostridium perfringens TaxID=1502 RepID=UPI0018E4B440|nr:Dam family site-specific DNA-(adenine-N6)-methyltransferase [Clostridium perfringens]EJT6154247.1 Dam family site-specific DNA-(adenine-N6)-methyltransferase [Clostridium perfringens]ELC8401474.1 Dam family site-specific DNA-(adenine-N6)-methyltransferase [Clostridium perfringens]MBI6103301.1 Dam family site-specific DNA-(adenine-N6)-methyltransferase [Clostridium perfringens]MDH2475909.1 Dam family site-specific DNA-(adenine-N6)-methyltransferase [Clostridium perfringens]MDK0760462.1 Dam f